MNEQKRPTPSGPFRLAVLNPGGGDPDQGFPDYAGTPGTKGHPPVNYHAYAACTAGSFHRDAKTIKREQGGVLLLLRRDLKLCLKSLIGLQAGGKLVAVSLKESGSHQVAQLLAGASRMSLFREICTRADFCLSSTPDLVSFYLGAGARRAKYLPTPYPVDDPRWDFSRPIGERRGVFIGTREFDTPSRNHLAALWAARQLGEQVTVFNEAGRTGRRRLEALGYEAGKLRVIEGRLDYPNYLRLMSEHRFVFQLDRSAVPGQVAGDALLCRLPCVGGDGAIDRLAFPTLTGFGHDPAELIEKATCLLHDETAYEQAVGASQQLAGERLSFKVTAQKLQAFFF